MDRLGKSKYRLWHTGAIPWGRCPKCDHPLDPANAKITSPRPPGLEAAHIAGSLDAMEDGGSYTAMIKCGGCGLTIQAAGYWAVKPTWNDEGEFWDTAYRPQWLSHTPFLVKAPESTPIEVRNELIRADVLFWADLAACATALRQVLEVFLDAQGISRSREKSGQGFRSLEDRIREFCSAIQKKDSGEAANYLNLLQATRIISNSITHMADNVTEKDVMLLAQFIERVLERRYSGDRLLDEAVRVITSHTEKRQAKPPNQPKATRKTKNPSGGQS